MGLWIFAATDLLKVLLVKKDLSDCCPTVIPSPFSETPLPSRSLAALRSFSGLRLTGIRQNVS